MKTIGSIHINGIRAGQRLVGPTNRIVHDIQFKDQSERYFRGYSDDTFETIEECQEAINKHLNGTRVYKPFKTLMDGKYFICKADEKE